MKNPVTIGLTIIVVIILAVRLSNNVPVNSAPQTTALAANEAKGTSTSNTDAAPVGANVTSTPSVSVSGNPGHDQQFVGTWICKKALGTATLVLNSDGKGSFSDRGKRLDWRSKDGQFEAIVIYEECGKEYQTSLTGRISSDQKKLLVTGWGNLGFYTPSAQEAFERF